MTERARDPIPPTAEAVTPAEGEHESALRRMEALAELATPARTLTLPSGRSVTIEAGEADRVTISGPQGGVELAIRFTKDGPVLQFSAAAISLSSQGDISLDCERLRVQARREVVIDSGGDVREAVAGAKVTEVGGAATLEAHAVAVTSRRGDVALKANDDVRIDGERVLLNS